jgi:hypothetical protein
MQWTYYTKHATPKKLGTISEFLLKQSKYVAFFRSINVAFVSIDFIYFPYTSLGGAVTMFYPQLYICVMN